VVIYSKLFGLATRLAAATVDETKPDYEVNVWTKPDCAGTMYENRNRLVQCIVIGFRLSVNQTVTY
jgi:hypothetical protein